MENRFENFTFMILKAEKQIQTIKNAAIARYGLKAVHVMCMHYLHAAPGELTSADLVRLTLEDKAAISRALALLKSRGYVDYRPGVRLGPVRLTEEGLKVAEYIASVADEAVRCGGEGLDEETRRIFYTSLQTITDNLSHYIEQEHAND